MEFSETHSVTSSRGGRYVAQPTGYRAFIPAPLPPDPTVPVHQRIASGCSLRPIAHWVGLTDQSRHLPNPDLFVYMYVRKEAVLSSQIEGTQSSLQDVLAAEAKIFTPNQPNDVKEVVNYVRAMNHGLKRLSELPVSVRLIREIHAELLEDTRGSHLTPGELRTSQNWIGASRLYVERSHVCSTAASRSSPKTGRSGKVSPHRHKNCRC